MNGVTKLELICLIFLKDNTSCYDIGCSTGTFQKLSDRNNLQKRVKFFGIDEVSPMIKKAKKM